MIEFVGLEATWFAKADAVPLIPRALRYCREFPFVSLRVEAARLLIVMAHDECDEALAAEGFKSVEIFLDESSANHANRFVPLHYHSVFGDRAQALHLLTRLMNDLDSFGKSERIRSVANAAVVCVFLGEVEKAYNLCMSHIAHAEAQGATVLTHFLLAQAVNALVTLERLDEARELHARARSLSLEAGRMHDSIQFTNEAEIALREGNSAEASWALERLTDLRIGTPRFTAYIEGLRARIHQIDPDFVADAGNADVLRRLHRKTARFVCADGLTQAIAVDLVRRGDLENASHFVMNYVAHERRERGPVPTAWQGLLRVPSVDRHAAGPALI